MGYAHRDTSDLSVAFADFHGVLAPGGRLCVLEIASPERAVSRAVRRAWLRGCVQIIAVVIAHHSDIPELMRYSWDTIAACVLPTIIMKRIGDDGLVSVDRDVELGTFSEFRARTPN